ncbi:MAG: hypothetical protein P8M34_12780 [Saprospiraceae bacterium]|nr:hypothetical protein [Saprospiraceae bacterium]|tara:strand:+ start:1642 stop:2319 length:678 start_codon:yes stop_codon:yes gene_type:complete
MLKKLKSLFVIEEESRSPKEESSSSTKVSKPQSKTSSSSKSNNAPTSKNIAIKEGAPQEKFVNILLEAVEKNNIDGFDYLEYKQSLQSLSKMNMDEATQFKSAYAMASTMGIDKDKLVKSVKHYLDVLKNEESKFNQALTNQINQKVGQRKQEFKTLDDTISQKENQIKQLSKEIEKHKKDLEKLKAEVDTAQGKVEGTKASFYGSYKVVASQMEEDLKKINQYL